MPAPGRTVKTRLTLLFALTVGVGCRLAPSSPIVEPPAEAASPLGPSASAPTSPVEVLSDIGHLRFLDDEDPSRGYIFEVRLEAKVSSPSGRGVSEIALNLSQWDELEALWARVRNPDGTVHELKPGDLELERPVGTYMMYTGARILRARPPSVTVGSIVEVGYRRRSRRPFDLPAWYVGGVHPVRLSRLEVDVPKGWELGWGARAEGRPLELEPRREGHKLVFERRDIPPIESDPWGPAMVERRGRLLLHVSRAPKTPSTVFTTWKDVGAWYRELIREFGAPPPEAVAALEDVLAGKPARAESVFAFVRDRIRYVAMFSGLGAFQPHAPAATWRSGFGDCKDMTTLTVALMRQHGLEAVPVLVATTNIARVDPRVPSAIAFNHAIVGVRDKGRWRYFDPTDKSADAGEVGAHLAGRDALLILENDARLVQLPMSGALENRREYRFTVAPGGRGTFEVVMTGLDRDWLRYVSKLPAADQQSALQRNLFPHFGVTKLHSWKFDPVPTGFRVHGLFDAAPFIKVRDGRRFVRAELMLRPPPKLPASDDRGAPLHVRHPFSILEQIRVLGVASAPEFGEPPELDLEGRGFELKSRLARHEDGWEIRREVVFEQTEYPAQALSQLRELSRRAARFARWPFAWGPS